MAIPHFRQQVISRGGGRSALAAAAYRHSAKMEDELSQRPQCYGAKPEHIHSEFAVPSDAPDWVRDLPKGVLRRKDVKLLEAETDAWVGREAVGMSEGFWNEVEMRELRADAALAHEVVIALPIELTHEQNVALIREYVADNYTSKGKVADWVYHDKVGNPHVHLMSSLRPLAVDGFGPKTIMRTNSDGTPVRTPKGAVIYDKWAGGCAELFRLRHEWGVTQNVRLSMYGHEARVHMGQLRELGIKTLPTFHRGVAANAMQQSVQETHLAELEARRRLEQFEQFQSDPSRVLDHLSKEHSTFGDAEITRLVYRYAPSFQAGRDLIEQVQALDDLVPIQSPVQDPTTGEDIGEARYSTYEVIEREWVLAERVRTLASSTMFVVQEAPSIAALTDVQAGQGFDFSPEQKSAITHALAANGLSVIAGYAGAGKSTVMTGVRAANEAIGRPVVGGALAGKAAVSLTESSGIEARTLASWEMAWERGRDELAPGTVFVLDEAGMVASDQMGRIVEKIEGFGAKLILVGDARQLQPINAGAAFRSIANEVGYVELSSVRRQQVQWQSEASVRFARGDALPAMTDYMTGGHIAFEKNREDARVKVLEGWYGDHRAAAETLMLAHTNVDVHALNQGARALIKQDGGLVRDQAFATERGERMFAVGDRVIFLRNDRRMDVQNGRLGEVEGIETEEPKAFEQRLAAWKASHDPNAPDDADDPKPTSRVTLHIRPDGADAAIPIASDAYRNIDHGYAATIHKSQGATIDRVHVLATNGFDAQLSYVAMTRHREDVRMTVALDTFAPRRRDDDGQLVPDESVEVSPKEALSRMVEERLKDTTIDYAETVDHGFSLREIAKLKERWGGRLPTREELKAGPPQERERVERLKVEAFLWRRGMPALGEAFDFLQARVEMLRSRLNVVSTRLTDVRTRIENRLKTGPDLAKKLGIEIRNGVVGELRSTAALFSPFPSNRAATAPAFDFGIRARSGLMEGSERSPDRGQPHTDINPHSDDLPRTHARHDFAQPRNCQESSFGPDDARSQMAHIHYMRRARFETHECVSADEMKQFNAALAALLPRRQILEAGPNSTKAAVWLAETRPELDGNLKERLLTLWPLVHAGQKATATVQAAMRFVPTLGAMKPVPPPQMRQEPQTRPETTVRSDVAVTAPQQAPTTAPQRSPVEIAADRALQQPVLIPARTDWPQTPAQEALSVALKIEENVQLRDRIETIAKVIWRDPAHVLSQIDTLAQNPAAVREFAQTGMRDAAALGTPRGRELFGRHNTARDAALKELSSLRPVVDRYGLLLGRDVDLLTRAFGEQRQALAEPLHDLSPEARALVADLTQISMGSNGPDLATDKIARGEVRQDLAEEVTWFSRELDKRFPYTWKADEVRPLQVASGTIPTVTASVDAQLRERTQKINNTVGRLMPLTRIGLERKVENKPKMPISPKVRM